MIVNGTVVSVELDVEINKKDGGSYVGARLTYRDGNGKINEQAFHNNTFKFNAPLKTSLANLKAGDAIEINKEKNKNDFWEVKSISKVAGGATTSASTASPNASPKSTYETAEERAKKQVYIIRQSSVASAVSLYTAFGKGKSVDDVILIAKQLEAYVLDTGTTEADEIPELSGDEGEVF